MTPHRVPPFAAAFATLILLLAALVIAPRAIADDTKCPYHKLKWEDFKGPAPTGTEDAEITSGTDPSWATDTPTGSGTNWKCKLKDVKVSAIMDKTKSGVKADSKTDALLQHEQYHFDISEYWAREMEKALKGVEGVGSTPQAAIDDATAKANKINADMDKKCDDMQEQYDTETDHGRDAAKQATWCTKIGNLLNPPKPVDNKSSSNNGSSGYSPTTKQIALGGFGLALFTHLGGPISDPYLQGATLVFPTLVYSGYHMDPVHALFMASPETIAVFQIRTVGSVIALTGNLRLLMGDYPDTAYTAWIETTSIDPVSLASSPFLQQVESSRATGQSVFGLRLSLSNPLSVATNQWTLPASVPATIKVGSTLCDPPTPPIIRQPTSHFVGVGGTTTFSVLVPAAGPFTYQWRKNTIPLTNGAHFSGVDDDTLKIVNCGLGDVGSYDVVVTSPCGGTTSSAGILSVTTGAPVADERNIAAALALMALAGIATLRKRRGTGA